MKKEEALVIDERKCAICKNAFDSEDEITISCKFDLNCNVNAPCGKFDLNENLLSPSTPTESIQPIYNSKDLATMCTALSNMYDKCGNNSVVDKLIMTIINPTFIIKSEL